MYNDQERRIRLSKIRLTIAPARLCGLVLDLFAKWCVSHNSFYVLALSPPPPQRFLLRTKTGRPCGRPAWLGLQVGFSVFGQDRARYALQGDVDPVGEVLEAFGQVGQPGAGRGQVRCVDLCQVAQAHHFGTGAGTGDDGFHLVRGQVLAFVDQDQALLEAAAPDVVEGFELQRHFAEDVVDAAMGTLVVHVQRFEVVGNRTQPRFHFFRFGAGQEADLLVEALHAAGGDDAPVALADHGLFDGGGQGQDGLAGTGGAGQVDQVDIRVEQGEQRQALVDVPRLEAPRLLVQQGFLMQIENQQFVDLDFLDPADEALFVDDEFVDVHRRQVVDQLHLVPGATMVLAGFDLAHAVPEGAGHGVVAVGQQRNVVDQLVGAVVLRRDPAGAGLEAHVDVFGHQHHGLILVARVQVDQLVDDDVVVQVFRQHQVGFGALAHQD